jgi:hypothetical protein
MRIRGGRFVAALLLGALLPGSALAQSSGSDEIQQLRKLIEQMNAKMTEMQAEIDELKGVKAQTPPNQPVPRLRLLQVNKRPPSNPRNLLLKASHPNRSGPRPPAVKSPPRTKLQQHGSTTFP